MSASPIEMAERLAELIDINERCADELGRLGKGVERIAAKYGAEHPDVANALHRLLRDRP